MIAESENLSHYRGNFLEDAVILSFGLILRQRRADLDMTQEEVGFAAGIQRKHVSSLELGLKQPTLGTVFKLAYALRLRPSELVAMLEDAQEDPHVKIKK